MVEPFPIDAYPDVPETALLGEDDRLTDAPMMREPVRPLAVPLHACMPA